ncbi:MAG: hypothetical protein ACTHMI_13445 [Mucilaginibacter sp.]
MENQHQSPGTGDWDEQSEYPMLARYRATLHPETLSGLQIYNIVNKISKNMYSLTGCAFIRLVQ